MSYFWLAKVLTNKNSEAINFIIKTNVRFHDCWMYFHKDTVKSIQ